MKKLIYITLTAAVATLASCINNDIPLANIEADITAFHVEGQVGASVISKTNRTISVELDESVDMASVEITDLETEAADGVTEVKTPLKKGDKINLLSAYTVTLTTYQDYEWTITATQSVSRSVTVENQVGSPAFDPAARTATVYVDILQSLDDITITGMKLGQEGSTIAPDFTTVHDFTSPVEFTVTYAGRSETWTVSVLHVDGAITGESDPWAKFAYLYGIYNGNDSEVAFEYRVKGASSWITVPAGEVTAADGDASCKLTGLEPVTTYEYRLSMGDTKGNTAEFTTETADQLQGMGFDEWWYDLFGKTRKIWYPNKDKEIENHIWDSGNKGTTLLKDSNTSPEESHLAISGEGKKAVKLQSIEILIAGLAAGNIYTGQFGKTEGFTGASLSMGVPYYSRPLRLKGYYDYAPGTIDKTKAPYTDLNGTTDKCHIYVVLAQRDKSFAINTNKAEFIDFENDPTIIAFGEFVSDETTGGYRQFSIELEYRDDRKPNMVVVVATASRYGDYFTGSTKSILYVDEFEFAFESD